MIVICSYVATTAGNTWPIWPMTAVEHCGLCNCQKCARRDRIISTGTAEFKAPKFILPAVPKKRGFFWACFCPAEGRRLAPPSTRLAPRRDHLVSRLRARRIGHWLKGAGRRAVGRRRAPMLLEL